jgi:hypothetical protein
VVAAFGDNLPAQAERAAEPLALSVAQLTLLRELGECMNYNAYGDSVQDLHFDPAELYRRLQPFTDPSEFATRDPAFATLREGYREDLAQSVRVRPVLDGPSHYLLILPDARWARRVHGVVANRLAGAHPRRAHAVLVKRGSSYRASVRAPKASPMGADELCRRFPTGGGRPEAAGIEALPAAQLGQFRQAFESAFESPPTGL